MGTSPSRNAGDVVDETLGIDCFHSEWRTAHRRATEIWNAAGGRFVWSQVAGHWVSAPR